MNPPTTKPTRDDTTTLGGVRVSRDDLERWRAAADEHGVTLAQLVRDALDSYTGSRRSAVEDRMRASMEVIEARAKDILRQTRRWNGG